MAWAICGLGTIFYSYEYILRILPSVMESELSAHYHLLSSGFGGLSAFYYYAYVPMQIPVGLLMDKYGPRRLLTLACLLCALGTYLFAATDMFYVAALGRFMVGLGSSFAFVGVLKLATMWLPEDRLAFVAGSAAALGTIGAWLGDYYLGMFVHSMGWVETTNFMSAFGFGLVVLLYFFIKDRADSDDSVPERDFASTFYDLAIIAKNKQIWVNGFYGCLVYLPTTVLAELWGIPYLTHAQSMSAMSAEAANGMIFLGFTLGAPIMGTLSDKFHNRKLPMSIGAIGAFCAITLVMYMPGLTEQNVRCLLFMLGICYGSQAIVFAVGRELAPKRAAGTAMAFTNMVVMLGGMFLQPLVGVLLDWHVRMRAPELLANASTETSIQQLYTGVDYQFALMLLPIGIFSAFLLTFLLKETHGHAVD